MRYLATNSAGERSRWQMFGYVRFEIAFDIKYLVSELPTQSDEAESCRNKI